jgi:dTMP kinase
MFASRTQAAAEIIVPTLERGDVVVSDRFTDSTLAYQGFARAIGCETVAALHKLTLDSLLPDLTIALEIDLETGLQRAFRRNQASDPHSAETRIDRQSLEFHAKVASGYRQIAASDHGRFRLVDGRGDPAEVAARVWAEAERMLRI